MLVKPRMQKNVKTDIWKMNMHRATTADSVIPIMVRIAKRAKIMMVVLMTGTEGNRWCKYSTPVFADITAVAIYERIVMQAARDAVNLDVQLSRQL